MCLAPVVPDHPPKPSHGPTLHHPTNNPTQTKWEQHDSTTTTHRTTVISSLVKKVEKLNRTNTHNAKQTARKTTDPQTNATIVMQIIDDTIEEYKYAHTPTLA